jgi:hypothetical protein
MTPLVMRKKIVERLGSRGKALKREVLAGKYKKKSQRKFRGE